MTQDPKKAPPAHRHEETDISIRQVLIWAVALAGVVIGSLVLMWIFFGILSHFSERPLEIRRSTRPEAVQSAKAPLLQSRPAQDLAAYRAAEKKILSNYAWIDRQNGVVRIPIERAMKIVADSKLPVRAAPKAAAPAQAAPAAAPAPAAQTPAAAEPKQGGAK